MIVYNQCNIYAQQLEKVTINMFDYLCKDLKDISALITLHSLGLQRRILHTPYYTFWFVWDRIKKCLQENPKVTSGEMDFLNLISGEWVLTYGKVKLLEVSQNSVCVGRCELWSVSFLVFFFTHFLNVFPEDMLVFGPTYTSTLAKSIILFCVELNQIIQIEIKRIQRLFKVS